MAKFHITEDGPKPCGAQVRPCPYGGESGNERHYDSMPAAEIAFALEMGGAFTPIKKKSPFKRQDEVRRGLGNDATANATLQELDEDARAFWASKDERETYLLNHYKMNGYVALKAVQLGGFYREGWERTFLNRYPDESQRQEVLRDTQEAHERLTKIYEDHGEASKPRVLYRLQNAQEFSPDGKLTADEYLNSLEPGQDFTFKTWASTTADSDFVLESGEKTREFHPDREPIVFEVVTKRGMPLHNPDDREDAVQAREREVLLAPGENYRVVSIQKDVLFKEARELSIAEKLGGLSERQGRYHVVQLEEVEAPAATSTITSSRIASENSRGSLPSPQERMNNARKTLQGEMINIRARVHSPDEARAAEVFDRASHEISRIKSKADAEALWNTYERTYNDAVLNEGRNPGSAAYIEAYRRTVNALADMLGKR